LAEVAIEAYCCVTNEPSDKSPGASLTQKNHVAGAAISKKFQFF
jgi:hypothetical protein